MVAEALALGVTVDGLTVQTGGSTIVVAVDVTAQARSTVPLKPLMAPTVMVEADVPPGATARGLNGMACRVTFWADALNGNASKVASRHIAAIPAGCIIRRIRLDIDELDGSHDRDDSDFNMSRVLVQRLLYSSFDPLASIPAIAQRLPGLPANCRLVRAADLHLAR
jgi:hypothetical protein